MNNNNKVVVYSPSCMILFIVFLVLKLTNVINWSWWWVTAPLWIPIAILIGIALFGIAILALAFIIEMISSKKKNKTN